MTRWGNLSQGNRRTMRGMTGTALCVFLLIHSSLKGYTEENDEFPEFADDNFSIFDDLNEPFPSDTFRQRPSASAQETETSFTVESGSGPLSEGAVLIQADTVTYDQEKNIIEAAGNVELADKDRILRADTLTYYQDEDRVTIEGNVSILESSGEVIFAKNAELSDEMKNGVVHSFEAVLQENARIVGNRMTRRDGVVNKISKAVYTACDVCNDAGETKTPIWQVKAFRITQDKEKLRVTYRDAFLELFGVPVLYIPYFSHADPSVKRKSGFLFPTIGDSENIGFVYEQPYYFALSPHYDLTVAPMYTSEDGTVLKGEWRQKFRNGEMTLEGSILDAEVRTDNNIKTGDNELRGHLFGTGRFQHNNNWSYGFDVELVNDDTYLRRFSFSNEVDLETRLFALGVDDRNYVYSQAFYFQGLRANDKAGLTPIVLPMVEGRYVYETDGWGRINFDASALVLQRTEGADSSRISLGADWERTFTTKRGQVIKPFINVRGDIYHTTDVNPAHLPSLPEDSETIARALPTAGIEWRWPFIKDGGNKHYIIEPIVQAVVSSTGGNDDDIPNEDSQTLEFDTTNLFSPNKYPGYDMWEDGERLNVGVKAGAYWNKGGEISAMLGRSYRFDDDSPFSPETGLADSQSDYVGTVKFAPNKNIDISSRFRLDPDDWSLRRNDIDINAKYWRVIARARYTKSDQIKTSSIKQRESVVMFGRLNLTKEWHVNAGLRRDIKNDLTLTNNFGITYEDECTIFSMNFRRQFYRDRDITPSDSIFFNLILKTLN